MKKLIVLMSATFLMGSSAIWAQSAGTQTQTDQSTSSSSSSTQSTDQNAGTSSSQSSTYGSHAKGMTQTWTGTLVDASCHDSSPTATCTPTSSTSRFGLMTADGQYFKLDKKSTSKAQSAIQSNASSSNASASAGSPSVTVTGKLEGKDTIRAESITAGSSSPSSMGAMNTSSPCTSSSSSMSSNASQGYPSSSTSGNASQSYPSSSTSSSASTNPSAPCGNASQSSASEQTSPSSATAGNAAATTYAGTLYDVTCHEQNPQGACPYTSTTATVGLMTSDGHFYKLDPASLAKVQDAMRARSNMTGQEKVSINGTLQGDTLTVDSVNIE